MKTARQLAQMLSEELTARGIRCALGKAVPYGQKVTLEDEAGRCVGALTCYWGRKGPKVTTHELQHSGAGLEVRAHEAREAALRRAGGALWRYEPSGGPEAGSEEGVHIWVDGSYVRDGDRAACGWGLVIVQDGEEVFRDAGSVVDKGFERQWNIAGEVTAVLKALEWCREKGVERATIHYDYEGLARWPLGEWKARNAHTEAYARAVRGSGIDIEWRKVRAHSGEPRNEVVDRLAREAAEAAMRSRELTQRSEMGC